MSRSAHARKSGKAKIAIFAVVASICVVGIGSLVVVNLPSKPAGYSLATTSTTSTPPPPLKLVSIGIQNIQQQAAQTTTTNSVATTSDPVPSVLNPGSQIVVNFSVDLAPYSPLPVISPAIPGSWAIVKGSTFVFTPAAPYVPGTTVSVTVPSGDSGVVGVDGTYLTSPGQASFMVAPGTIERLQQILAQLNYLPLSFTLSSTTPVDPGLLAANQVGTFNWKYPNTPASLQSLWSEGSANVITKGAVMAFELANHLTTDGQAGPQVWQAMLSDLQNGALDPNPYNYVMVSKTLPENVQVWSQGNVIYQTLANTGIPQAPTPNGTWPVYERFTTTTMSGKNPDGSTYHDTGIPWVSYFFGGDALHGFIRSSYGYPQSLGCVEMPYSNAGAVFPMTPIGTLVTVN